MNHESLVPYSLARSHALDSRWRGFFVAMAAVLLAIVAVGFAPSFYLRTYFDAGTIGASSSSLPTRVLVHGVVLSCWFLLFLTQTILVASREIRLHRTIGVIGAGLSVALIASSMLVVVGLASRVVARGNPSGQVALIVTGDTGLMLLFAVLIAAGITLRRRRDVHRRLMLLASISIVAPALARFPGAEALVPLSVVVPQLVLFGALIAYDILTSRRVHPATIWGVAMYVFVAGSCTAIGFSEYGRAFVKALA
jgi:hypothetical protein